MGKHHDPTIPPDLRPHEWHGIITRYSLNRRQSQVLGLAIQSHKDHEIVRVLGISKSTVRTYLKQTKNRLSAKDRVGLAYRVLVAFRDLIGPK
jgi:DNA-binding NarL/FixJ family response regulator